ncbi:nucleoid-associated protein [Pokkaliibacter sp. CJK22405]|uniref:nucleoid-associated protein n=1 Tax=Pokkaliibacter sp. CJK22405 TaxID=3384615 RepID=UPI003985493B
MAVRHLTIHAFQKTEDGETQLLPRQDSLHPTPAIEHLISELNRQLLSKAGRHYGRFQKDSELYPFSRLLREHKQGTMPFMKLSFEFLNLFKRELDNSDLSLSGYLLFAYYETPTSEHLLIALLQNADAMAVNDELELTQSRYLDLSKVQLAANVDLAAWEENSERYVCFTQGKSQRRLADHFAHAVGCLPSIDREEQTEKLLEQVAHFSQQLPADQQLACRSAVYDYCVEQEKLAEPVRLEELAKVITPEAPDRFSDYAKAQPSPLPEEIIPQKQALRQLVRFNGRSSEVQISFAAGCLGKNIEYREDTDTLIIQGLPESLKHQLRRYALENEDHTTPPWEHE